MSVFDSGEGGDIWLSTSIFEICSILKLDLTLCFIIILIFLSIPFFYLFYLFFLLFYYISKELK